MSLHPCIRLGMQVQRYIINGRLPRVLPFIIHKNEVLLHNLLTIDDVKALDRSSYLLALQVVVVVGER